MRKKFFKRPSEVNQLVGIKHLETKIYRRPSTVIKELYSKKRVIEEAIWIFGCCWFKPSTRFQSPKDLPGICAECIYGFADLVQICSRVFPLVENEIYKLET